MSTNCRLAAAALLFLSPMATTAYFPPNTVEYQDELLIESTQTSDLVLIGTVTASTKGRRGIYSGVSVTLTVSETLVDVRGQDLDTVDFFYTVNQELRPPEIGEEWIIFLTTCDGEVHVRSPLNSGKVVGAHFYNSYSGTVDLLAYKQRIVAAAEPCDVSYQVDNADLILQVSVLTSTMTNERLPSARKGKVSANISQVTFDPAATFAVGQTIDLTFPDHLGSRIGPLGCLPQLNAGQDYLVFLRYEQDTLRLLGSPWSALPVLPDGKLGVIPSLFNCLTDPVTVDRAALQVLIERR